MTINITPQERKELAAKEQDFCVVTEYYLNICKSPDIVMRMGVRCLKGCHGEGIFIAVCELHVFYIIEVSNNYCSGKLIYTCCICGSDVELFKPQRI